MAKSNRDRVGEINPGVPVLDPGNPGAAAALVYTGTRRPAGFTSMANPSLFDVHQVRTIKIADPISPANLDMVLDSLDPGVLRAKAVIRSTDDQMYLVQVVGPRKTVTVLPQAEAQNPTDMVVVELRDD